MNKIYVVIFSFALFLPFCFNACSSPSSKKIIEKKEKKPLVILKDVKLTSQEAKPVVKIYLENSGSMFGYIRSGGNFVNVISQIAGDCDLEAKKVSYVLINGVETKLGANLSKFTKSLSVKGMRVGDPSTSDLNMIFSKALKNAGKGKISILISDGIYSVNGSPSQLLAKLKTQSIITRNNFIKRLKEENLVTQLIKLKANFKGNYYPAAGGKVNINQERPYYVWVIGKKEYINKVFPDNYFEDLPGFIDVVKYIKLDENKPSCGLLKHKVKGNYTYRLGLSLNDVEPRNLVTSFSVGFDFSHIPLPSSYFDQTEIYRNNLGYKVVSVDHFSDLSSIAKASAQRSIKSNCSHIVTFEKRNAPWGNMNLVVKNLKPLWIDNTHDNDDANIKGDASKTFGFKFLTKGINDAYQKVNKSENIAEYKIIIKK